MKMDFGLSDFQFGLKVVRSLENFGILLKEDTRKISSPKGWFLNFVRPLMSVGLPLMKNVLTPSAKSYLVPLGITAAASATDAVIQKKLLDEGQLHWQFHMKKWKISWK